MFWAGMGGNARVLAPDMERSNLRGWGREGGRSRPSKRNRKTQKWFRDERVRDPVAASHNHLPLTVTAVECRTALGVPPIHGRCVQKYDRYNLCAPGQKVGTIPKEHLIHLLLTFDHNSHKDGQSI